MSLRENYLKVANKIVSGLKKDTNVVAIFVYGSLATDTLRKGSDIDLLIIVKKIPEGLDIFNLKHKKIDGIMVDLNYNTEKELISEIDFEVGCWLTSGMIMGALSLYDPNKVLDKLKKHIISIPKQKKKEAFKVYIDESKLYPDKLKNTSIDDLEKNVFLMREWVDLSRALFILNNARPSSEDGLFNEIQKLKKKPSNFTKLFKTVYGIDISTQKLEKMRETFFELYAKLNKLKFEI